MIAVVQSRFSSKRLPGKALKLIYNREMLGRVLDRIRLSKSISKIIVATSQDAEDDKIISFCEREHVNTFRGNLDDVLSRFFHIFKNENVNGLVRINGDSPLIDPDLIDLAVDVFKKIRSRFSNKRFYQELSKRPVS